MAMFGDTDGCHNWEGGEGATGIYWLGPGAAKHLTMNKAASMTKNYLAQNVNSTEPWKPCSSPSQHCPLLLFVIVPVITLNVFFPYHWSLHY